MKWLVLWSVFAARLWCQPTEPVRVSGGLVRGVIALDGSHVAYYGIPYGTVRDRFQEAEPNPTWEGVKNAFDENIKCPQRSQIGFTTRVVGQQDCLTLNVYTPLESPRKLRDVMVFIHGGGFRDGSNSPFIYGPQHLVKRDIILVAINYRLEVLGFLCLGIKEAPGNVGLKDQVLALKWVQENIEAFGGDPKKVTIFGESAGAASVSYHLLSPLSKGLFQQAIMQSGSALAPWAFQFHPTEIAHLHTKHMGFDTRDPQELLKIYLNKTDEELLLARVPRTKGDVVLSENIFVPCLEKKIPGVEPFLLDYPYNLFSTGTYNKVPVIIGFNNAEGLFFTGKENETMRSQRNFHNSLPRNLHFLTEEERNETAQLLKEYYIGDKDINEETIANFSNYEGDSGITYPVIEAVDFLIRTSDKPVYIYKFCYAGLMNLGKVISGFFSHPGATHVDDLFYMFKITGSRIAMSFEKEMTYKISTMWTNFAKYGNPVPNTTNFLPLKWPVASELEPQVFVIDDQFSISTLWEEPYLIWKNIYSKYRRKT